MNKYIGTKMIEAEPMTKGVYNESRGRAVSRGSERCGISGKVPGWLRVMETSRRKYLIRLT